MGHKSNSISNKKTGKQFISSKSVNEPEILTKLIPKMAIVKD